MGQESKRLVCSFTGKPMRQWKSLRDRYPDKSDTEILRALLRQTSDPWDTFMQDWEELKPLAEAAMDSDEYRFFMFIEPILRKIHAGHLDPETALMRVKEVVDALDETPDDLYLPDERPDKDSEGDA